MWKKEDWIIFLVSFLVLALFTKTDVGSWNDASRMAEIQSIVEFETFAIDQSEFVETGDKVRINDHFYSDKPALSYLIGMPIYFILYNLGITFSEWPHLTYYLITLLTIGSITSIMLVYFFRLIKRYELKAETKTFYAFSLVFGTLILAYSTVFNSNILGAAFLFFSFYLFLNAKTRLHYLLAGMMAGFTASIDLVPGSFFLIFSVILLFLVEKKFIQTSYFITGTLVPILVYLMINLVVSGSIIPFNMNPEFFDYPGSAWNSENLGVVLTQPLSKVWKYSFDIIFGSKAGFLFYSPILYFSLIALFLAINQKKYRTEGIILALSLLASLLFWIFKTDHYGGCSYGMRYTVSFIPILYSFTPLIFKLKNEKLVRTLKLLFIITLFVSIAFSLVGVVEPWTCQDELSMMNHPLRELFTRIFHNSISIYKI